MVSPNDEVQNMASTDVQVACQDGGAEIKQITEEEMVKAQKLFQQGKKNLMLNKFAESVNNIEEACRVYSAKYGEFDAQCADVYFNYGKALLELARVENNVLGNALTGVPEDTGPIDDSRYGNPDEMTPEEKESISEKVIDALCTEEGKPCETSTATTTTVTETTTTTTPTCETTTCTTTSECTTTTTTEESKPTTECGETKPSEGTETTAPSGSKEGEGEAADEEDEEEDDDEEDVEGEGEPGKEGEEAETDEEISNLQRAWEMFEMAKLVYTKHFEEDRALKCKRTAECLLKLGEISIEQESFEQACGDIKESIRLQEELVDAERDERMLAESYYQLGLAQQLGNLFEDARESFQRALNILRLRTEKLRAQMAACGDDEDMKTKLGEEIADIEALMPELSGKLEEVNEQDKQSMAAIQEAKECFMTAATNGSLPGVPANGGEVKDITCMMKSKRKCDGSQEEPMNGCGLKKTRLSGANGEEAATNGNGNGTCDAPMQAEMTPAETTPCETAMPAATTETA